MGEGVEQRLDGVLVVDKPAGMTSHDVVDAVRAAAGQRKVGHTGTLDPDATGVLVVCLGRATRLVRFLQDSPKTYEATGCIGVETTTQDASGDVVAEAPAGDVTEAAARAAFEALVGELEQVPPMVSAIKVGGERLHHKARRGEDVDRPARRVTVHELAVTSVRLGDRPEVSFTVTCSPGTYVRTLVHDAGRSLGVGAHLTSLRRTRNAGYTTADALALDDIRARSRDGTLGEAVQSLDAAASRALPTVTVGADDARAAAYGQRGDARGVDGPYALVHDHRLLAVAHDEDDRLRYDAVFVRPEDLEEGAPT